MRSRIPPIMQLLALVSAAFLIPSTAGETLGMSTSSLQAAEVQAEDGPSTGETEHQELAGTNIIRTSRSASIRVSIPHKVSVDASFNSGHPRKITDSISISGKGRVTGILLVPDPIQPSSNWTLLATRVGSCQKIGCDARKSRFLNLQNPGDWDSMSDPEERLAIPMGKYHLYVLADDEPIEVTLRLKGLTGRQVIRPNGRFEPDLSPVEVELNDTEGPSAYSAGNTYESGSRGLILATLFVEADDPAKIAKGVCRYSGSPRPPAFSHGPHCLALTGVGNVGLADVDPAYTFFYLAAYHPLPVYELLADGQVGMGAWVTSPQPLRRVTSQIFTVPLVR